MEVDQFNLILIKLKSEYDILNREFKRKRSDLDLVTVSIYYLFVNNNHILPNQNYYYYHNQKIKFNINHLEKNTNIRKN